MPCCDFLTTDFLTTDIKTTDSLTTDFATTDFLTAAFLTTNFLTTDSQLKKSFFFNFKKLHLLTIFLAKCFFSQSVFKLKHYFAKMIT